MKQALIAVAIVVAMSLFTYYLITNKPPHFTGDWVRTEGIYDKIPRDSSGTPPFSTDSVKYILYYGRTFVSEDEVIRILLDHRERCADAINYYKSN